MESINQPKLKTKQNPPNPQDLFQGTPCSKGHPNPPPPQEFALGVEKLYQHRVLKSLRSYTSLLAKITALSLVFSEVLVSLMLLL